MRSATTLLTALTAAALLAAAAPSDADELHRWGKPPVRGTVIAETDEMVKFKTETGEVLEVPRTMIRKIITDAEAETKESTEPDAGTPDPVPATATGPVPPGSRGAAGGWMMLLEETGKVVGWRSVVLKREGDGFALEQRQFQLNAAGQPQFIALAKMTFGAEMQCLGAASRVLQKSNRRTDKDDVQKLQMGGGKIRVALQDRGAASQKAPSYDVPQRTIFRGAELGLLLHSKLAQDLMNDKAIEPFHLPFEYALQHGGKTPDGQTLPMTTLLKVERVGLSEPNPAGFRTLKVKMTEEAPKGMPFPGSSTTYEVAVAPGKPVKLLSVETAGGRTLGNIATPKQTHAAQKTVTGHAIYDLVPPQWRDLALPIAPDALLPSKEK